MSPLGQVFSSVTAALAAIAIAGLVRRRRARACPTFVAYLVSAIGGHLLLVASPRTFWTWEFLIATDVLQALLLLGTVVEITTKSFRALPAGYQRVRQLLAFVSLAAVAIEAFFAPPVASAADLSRLLEHVSYGIGFLFIAFMAAVRWYGVPIDPLHRTVATGFAFVTMLVGCVSALAELDPMLGFGRDFIVKTAYPCVLAWWAASAWRHDDFGRLSPEAVRRLHPWRLP